MLTIIKDELSWKLVASLQTKCKYVFILVQIILSQNNSKVVSDYFKKFSVDLKIYDKSYSKPLNKELTFI